jgi:hypothetical protein
MTTSSWWSNELRVSPAALSALFLAIAAFLVIQQRAVAQTQVQSSPYKGAIHGTVINQDGTPAKGLTLNAAPLGVMLAMPLPWAKTNDDGHQRKSRLNGGLTI